MNLEKKYKTQEGVECDILQLVKMEPEWAANMIQHYEEKLASKSPNSAEPKLRHHTAKQQAADAHEDTVAFLKRKREMEAKSDKRSIEFD